MKVPTHLVRVAPIVVLLAILATVSGAFAASGKPSADPQILGSWNLLVATSSQQFPGLMTFTSGGGLVTDEPPLPGETSGHGNWVGRGDGEVGYTFVALLGAPDASYAGKLKVVGTLRFDNKAGTWSGPYKIVVYDPSGQPTFEDRGTFTMTRIEIEDLN